METALTKKELAQVAGYTYRQLHNIDISLPEDRKLFVLKEGTDKYDLFIFVQRWVDFNVARDTSKIVDLDQIKAKHEAIKAEKTQLEVDKMKSRLVDVNDVRHLWGNIANTVVQNMLHIPHKLAPMLRMVESTEEISYIIDEEIRKVLQNISETPLPEDASEENEDGEDNE